MKDLRKYVAEFIGTAVLVFVACGVAGQVCDIGGAGHLMTALAFGLVRCMPLYGTIPNWAPTVFTELLKDMPEAPGSALPLRLL